MFIKPGYSPKFLIFLILIAVIIIPAQALSPLWISNLTEIDQNIQDTGGHSLEFLAISDYGSSVATATFDGSIYFIDESGIVIWNKTARNETSEILALSLSPDGNYLAFSNANPAPASNPQKRITLLNRQGEELWNHSTTTFVYNLEVSSDGLYSVFGSHENITCVDRNGSIMWNHPVTYPVLSLDISDDCEYIVAVTENGGVFCLNQSGSLLWENKFWEPCDIKISDDGNYVCLSSTSQIRLYFLDNKGTVLWNKTLLQGTKFAESGISYNGEVMVLRTTKAVSGYNQSGGLRWNYITKYQQTLPHPISAPGFSLSKDGRYYVFAAGESLILLDDKGNEAGTFSCDNLIKGVAISSKGTGIAAITNNELYYFCNSYAGLKGFSDLSYGTKQSGDKPDETSPVTQTKQSPIPLFTVIFSAGLASLFMKRRNRTAKK